MVFCLKERAQRISRKMTTTRKVKKNKKTAITKFKLRTPKYLYTLKVDDTTKAEKIMQSIPPNLKKDQIGGSK